MVSILPFTRRGRNGASSATASPAPPQGGGGLAARTKAALSGVGAGGMLGGGGVGRLVPGCGLPHVTLPTVQGGHLELGAPSGTWTLLVIHRGVACPISRTWVAGLSALASDFADAGFEIVTVTADGADRAAAFCERVAEAAPAGGAKDGLGFKACHSLPAATMAAWGLYASTPSTPRGGFGGTDAPIIPEPATIILDSNGAVYAVDISSSPFTRPDLAILLESCRFLTTSDYPARGTYELA